MKRFLAILVGTTLCLSASAALAQKVPPPMMKKALKDAGLNAETIKKMEDLNYQADREMLDIRHDLQAARLEMRKLMSADSLDEGAIMGQLEKISALQLKQEKNRVGLMLKIRKLVTAEQWEKLQIMRAEHERHKRDRRGMAAPEPYGEPQGPLPRPPEPPVPPVPPAHR